MTVRFRAHPRVCGEHSSSWPACRCGWGSSPRLRGALDDRHRPQGRTGLIPASAGSTHIRFTHCSQIPAHPRVCGEHRWTPPVCVSSAGSSPRLRGAPLHFLMFL